MMKYYRNQDGEVFGFDEDEQPELIDQAIDDGLEDVTASWPPEPEVVVPELVTPRQGLIMLSRVGLLAPVNAAIDAIGGQTGEEARIDFDRANEWRRDWPLINNLAAGIGLTSEQIDDLFIAASQI